MKISRVFLTVALGLGVFAHGRAAIDPEEFKRVASDVFRLREIARVVQPDDARAPKRQRITLVAEIVETLRSSLPPAGRRVIVIDYAIDLVARTAEQKDHEKKMAGKAGRQFMHEPDAPKLDERKEFWAHLAPIAGRLANVNRHAGKIIAFEISQFSGPVFVPVAGQYSWDAPARAAAAPLPAPPPTPTPAPKPEAAAGGDTFTGVLRTGIMQIGGETTGVILETATGTYELETRGTRLPGERLEALDGKRVVVTGDYRPRAGVEVKERRIILVRTLREAPLNETR